MRVSSCFLLALGALFLFGCVRETVPSSQHPTASGYGGGATQSPDSGSNRIVSPEEGLEGKIAWINSNLRFVVVTFPVGRMPAIEQRLNVYRQGLKVGEVKITGPQRDDSIVGDIVAGEAGAGDAVWDR
jgi:hypothetical protein